MAKIHPETGEMMSDDPEFDWQSGGGGKLVGDLPEGANTIGSDKVHRKGHLPEDPAKTKPTGN